MAPRFRDRLAHAFNVFVSNNSPDSAPRFVGYGESSGVRPDRPRFYFSNERSIITSVYTRLGIDVASIDIRHVRLDPNERFVETIKSGLNECLNLRANIDQYGRQFKQDLAMTLFDKGVIAVVPVETSIDPEKPGSFDIQTIRVGIITQWFPRHVRIDLYNDRTGRREEVTLSKESVAIVENPLFAVMNEPNSTLQRLIRKLNILDAVDEASSSGKLDLIIQLPFAVKSETKKQQAEQRTKDIEVQLKGSRYGIAYADATEKITQLNRPAENNLLGQIEYLTKMLYGQLGLTESIFTGSATEAEMLNYHNRTIEPVVASITQAFKSVFLTKTARTQGQSIEFYRDPFKLVPVASIAEIADAFTRNEILSANEVRGIIGFRPATDPKADELVNSNMPQPNSVSPIDPSQSLDMEALMEETFAKIEASIDDIVAGTGGS